MGRTVAILGTRGYPSYYGGFETAVRRLAPYLAEQGWRPTVYCRPGGVKADDPSADPRVATVMTSGLETSSLSTLSYGLTSVLHAVMHRPDVALVMNVANGFWLPFLRLRGVPTVVNVDGIEWERAKWGRIARCLFRMGAKLTARFATTIVADSVEIQKRWLSEFGRESLFIPYGGDYPERTEVFDGLQTGSYILVVARFVPENSIQEFFDAVPYIPNKYKVVLVGSSGYGGVFDHLASELAARHDHVTWLGHVSDHERLLSLWQHSGVYFHGHSVGGTNPALVQAMACGAPVVARDTVYNREVLGEAGTFTTTEPQEIARRLIHLLEAPDLREKQISLGKQRVQDIYNWSAVCAKYAEGLSAAAASRPTSAVAK